MRNVIQIHQTDNVAVALAPLAKGTSILSGVVVSEDIAQGHKVAITDIPEGHDVIKYGYAIGRAKSGIARGGWVHTHNLATKLDGQLEYHYTPKKITPQSQSQKPLTFEGFVRADGRVGIRNEIWIIPTVGCVNGVGAMLANSMDGVYCFGHPYGCSQMGEDQKTTQKLLAALVNHPNAAGVLVLGLGCENNNIPEFIKVLGEYDERRVKFLSLQSEENEMEKAKELLSELAEYAKSFHRQEVSASKLVVGMKCGGSDGLSGITANPMLGVVSDMLVAQGGTSILTEVPEMFGAETILMERCESKQVFDKTVAMINGFKDYFQRYNQVVYENPSPGNKQGGISSLEDKSLGCIQKGGTASIVDVLDYAERVKKPGLQLLYGPGNDLVSATALTAAGAQVVLFSTGRGTPFGAPAPTVKIATNSALAKQKRNWIDFDAGVIAQGEDMATTAKRFFAYLLELASGKILTKSEINGFREIAIFKEGVTL